MAVKLLLSGNSMVAQWLFDGGLVAHFLEPEFLSIKATT
jgi:hypothetical protein